MDDKLECDLCSEKVEESTLQEVSDNMICESCYDDETENCDECDTRFVSDDGHYQEGFGLYCTQECFWNDHSRCDNCDDIHASDNISDGLCDDCHDNQENEDDCFEFNEPRLKFFKTKSKRYLNTSDLTIGIELETYNRRGLSTYNDAEGMSAKEKAILWERVCAKGDGSLDNGGVEFTTLPTSNSQTYTTVSTLTKFLKKNGFNVNERCGYHLHIGEEQGKEKLLTPINRHKIMITYAIFKDTLFDFCTPTRKGNTYCDCPRFNLIAEMFTKSSQSRPEAYYNTYVANRYNLINYHSWGRHNTLEIRSHEGTIDYKTVMNWIKVNLALFNFAINTDYKTLLSLKGSWYELKKKVLKDQKLIQYYLIKRKNHLQGAKISMKRSPSIDKIIIKDLKKKAKMKRQPVYDTNDNNLYINLSGKSENRLLPELVALMVKHE